MTAFVADGDGHTIRSVDVGTGRVTTIAGSGAAGYGDGVGPAAVFSSPIDIDATPDGSTLLICDYNNRRIRKLDLASGTVSTLAGSGAAALADGTGAAAAFNIPHGVAVAPDGLTAVVADFGNHRLRLIVLASQVVTTIAGSGVGGSVDGIGTTAQLNHPTYVAFTPDGQTLLICDQAGHRVRAMTVSSRSVWTLAGSGGAGYADGVGTLASFNMPYGVAVTPDGAYALIGQYMDHRVRAIDLSTRAVTTLAGSSAGHADGSGSDARFNNPAQPAVSPDGKTMLIADLTNHRVRKIDLCPVKVRRCAW